ncbi:uracil-DNA glycosylase [Salinibacterium sp. SWN167]|uniref:uracil-DNA glycosylase n=1 Tax=Salinibacterium sp. SWN167 TaxID=2792054 RepID=UPI0018CFCC2D|nr:uracil-DNA glycosylase [Salinibacterium sp. SWN167]MBH0084574.1 uracil-DNA glycosylase [Salinibacterium sp. SWN167]
MDLSSVDPGWARELHPLEGQLEAVGAFLDAESAAGRPWLPEPDAVLRAFEAPYDQVRVLVVGQDPYPTPGHAVGLAFSADRAVRPLPRSLSNIYKELHDDLGIPPAAHADLSAWQSQGVLLLNRVLTVQAGVTGSHRRHGWEEITAAAIRALAARPQPLVAVLWGKEAAAVAPLLGDTPVIVSAHPSPLSARRGFFGSKPFSRVNAALEVQGAAPIDWRVDRSLDL